MKYDKQPYITTKTFSDAAFAITDDASVNRRMRNYLFRDRARVVCYTRDYDVITYALSLFRVERRSPRIRLLRVT